MQTIVSESASCRMDETKKTQGMAGKSAHLWGHWHPRPLLPSSLWSKPTAHFKPANVNSAGELSLVFLGNRAKPLALVCAFASRVCTQPLWILSKSLSRSALLDNASSPSQRGMQLMLALSKDILTAILIQLLCKERCTVSPQDGTDGAGLLISRVSVPLEGLERSGTKTLNVR